MGIVKFSFDKKKDLENIWETANSKLSYGTNFKERLTKNISDICEGKKYPQCKRRLAKEMENFYKNPLLNSITDCANKSWEKIEKEYFKRMEKLTKRKFLFKQVNAYLTTSGRCPYNPHGKSPHFYFNFFDSIQYILHVAGHELMHIHLHNTDWWKNVENQIGYDKTHDLKEAVTVLLNTDFIDLWIVPGQSYPNHVKLSEYIIKKWEEKKDFDKLTEDCIKWIKRNGIK